MWKKLADRQHKVHQKHLGRAAEGLPIGDRMPQLLAAQAVRDLAEEIIAARRSGLHVWFAIGGHVVKSGCGPFLADLIRKGMITGVSMVGAAAIHDAELALCGHTSECVEDALQEGSFGYSVETHDLFARAAADAVGRSLPLGTAVAMTLQATRTHRAHDQNSVLLTALDRRVPLAVHVAVGTDTVHLSFQAAADMGAASATDFRAVCDAVASPQMSGGVWVNCGSAVFLPEVLLKAVAFAAHNGSKPDLITANIDLNNRYRTSANVLTRPALRSYALTGCHSILLPLLHAAVATRRDV